MFSYYFELINKPKYMLSEAESAFIELFPLVILAGVCAAVIFVVWLIDLIKGCKK